MSQIPSPNAFAGLLCPHCAYDVRGLARAICPECGHPFDPDAQPAASRCLELLRRGWQLSWRWLPPLAAIVSAGWIVWESIDLSLTFARELGGQCGSVRMWAAMRMNKTVPARLIIPVTAAIVSIWTRRGASVARVAAVIAIASWAVCYGLAF